MTNYNRDGYCEFCGFYVELQPHYKVCEKMPIASDSELCDFWDNL